MLYTLLLQSFKQTRVIWILFSVFFITSCNSNKTVVQEIRELENRVDSLNTVYNKIPFAEINKLLNEMVQNTEFIKNHSEELFKINKDYISYYGSYTASMKIMSRLANKKSKTIPAELTLAKSQLENLKHDVKNKLIPQDSVLFFLEKETEAVNELLYKVKSIEDGIVTQKKVFEQTNPQILEIINKGSL